MEKKVEDKIQELQMIEQNLQGFLSQKQTFQAQLMEIESALKELQNSETAYKIVGNIMVKADKAQLAEELNSKKEIAELRIKTLERQETKLRESASGLQKEVLEEMNKK